MVPDVNEFRQKYESKEFNINETISPGFYEFEFMKYIEFNKLIKEIIFDSSKQFNNNTELIVSNKITKVEIARFLNNYFYVGCNVIKSDYVPKQQKRIKIPRNDIKCEVDDLHTPIINRTKTTFV
jgi:ribosomal protein L23